MWLLLQAPAFFRIPKFQSEGSEDINQLPSEKKKTAEEELRQWDAAHPHNQPEDSSASPTLQQSAEEAPHKIIGLYCQAEPKVTASREDHDGASTGGFVVRL